MFGAMGTKAQALAAMEPQPAEKAEADAAVNNEHCYNALPGWQALSTNSAIHPIVTPSEHDKEYCRLMAAFPPLSPTASVHERAARKRMARLTYIMCTPDAEWGYGERDFFDTCIENIWDDPRPPLRCDPCGYHKVHRAAVEGYLVSLRCLREVMGADINARTEPDDEGP